MLSKFKLRHVDHYACHLTNVVIQAHSSSKVSFLNTFKHALRPLKTSFPSETPQHAKPKAALPCYSPFLPCLKGVFVRNSAMAGLAGLWNVFRNSQKGGQRRRLVCLGF
jgi:hypothetical protein